MYAGLNTSLVRLELAANQRLATIVNEDRDEVPAPSARPPATDADGEDAVIVGDSLPYHTQIKPILAEALARNRALQAVTAQTALKLLPVARVLLHATARRVSAQEIRQQVEDLNEIGEKTVAAAAPDRRKGTLVPQYTYSDTKAFSGYTISPLLQLPPELVANILRVYSALEPIPLPPSPAEADSFDPLRIRSLVLASALSENQFMRVLAVAQDRRSLTQPVKPMLGSGSRGGNARPVYLEDSKTFLHIVGCSKYERRAA